MNLEAKLKRSESTERIDFSKLQSKGEANPLVTVSSEGAILVEPCWSLENDWEGKRYADYILGHPNYDGVYLRAEVARRLTIAAASLPTDYKLVIRAGHRPIEVQRRILIDCAEEYKAEHPDMSDEEALEHARDFVSDPAITLPPHVCGAAVDVELVDIRSEKLLDFGSKMNEDTEKSFLHYSGLTEEQKNNRSMLLTTMLAAGFASCMTEWWHFSYGDQTWAWFYGETESLYSPVDL
jgi:D-alanyl-D-alanine dipeptidase